MQTLRVYDTRTNRLIDLIIPDAWSVWDFAGWRYTRLADGTLEQRRLLRPVAVQESAA